jgi:hypothetical protein
MRWYLHELERDGRKRLHLVAAALWNGHHERTAFLVVDSAGDPVRLHGDNLDYVAAHQAPSGGWYINRPHGGRLTFQTQDAPAVPEKTECRRLASRSRRARCALCAEDEIPLLG